MCADVGPYRRCLGPTAPGTYVFDGFPVAIARVTAQCDTRGTFPKQIVDLDVRLSDSTTRRTIGVSTAGCDTRPLRYMMGVFSGFWVSGFEESSFGLCGQETVFLPGDSSHRVWVRFAGVSERQWKGLKWPAAGEVRLEDGTVLKGYDAYFLRVRGVLEGPGHYGHMGVANFLLTVDTVLSIDTSGKNDCARR
jgi:hypothetical protein